MGIMEKLPPYKVEEKKYLNYELRFNPGPLALQMTDSTIRPWLCE